MADGVNHRRPTSKPSSNYSLKVSTENLRHDQSKEPPSELPHRGDWGVLVSSPSSGAMDSPQRRASGQRGDHYEPHRDTVVLLNDGLPAVVVGSRKSSSANNVDAGNVLVIDNVEAVRGAGQGEAGLGESFRGVETEDPPPYDDVEGEGGVKKKEPSCMERLESLEIFVHQMLER